jgi:ketosteroid isomerase-like protein
VGSIYAAWERGRSGSFQWAHRDIEHGTADGRAPGWVTGKAGMAKAIRDWMSLQSTWRLTRREIRELDDERVLVLVRHAWPGTGSGIGKTRSSGAALFHVKDGKVARLTFYLDGRRALADLGEAAEADPPS